MGYGVIPDKGELEQWLRQGLTARECSERYAARGLDVPITTINVARWRGDWTPVHMNHAGLIPWTIRPPHRRRYDHRMLMTESRRRQGAKISEKETKQLDAWLLRLNEQDAVIHYKPDSEEGWFWVQRRPGIDTDIISMPNLDDEDEVKRLRPGAIPVLRGLVAATS